MNILFIGNGFDIAHNIKIEFKSFIKSPEFSNHISKHYKNYFQDKTYKEIIKNSSYLWSDFEQFLFSLLKNNSRIRENYFIEKINELFQNWFNNYWNNYQLKPINQIDEVKKIINKNKYYLTISFNYTTTMNIYGFEMFYFNSKTNHRDLNINNLKNKCINIHQFKEKNNNYILGHDNFKKYNKDFYIEKWGKENKKFNPKEQILKSLLENKKKINLISFYGFAFGTSDNKMINFLLDISKDVNIEFYTKDHSFKENITTCFKKNKKYKNAKKLDFYIKS